MNESYVLHAYSLGETNSDEVAIQAVFSMASFWGGLFL